MDLVVLRRLVAELSQRLVGQRVDQVYALPRYDVALVLSERGSPRLWFAADPDDPRLYLRRGGHLSPARPPAFAMAARKWARGQRIGELSLVGDDRVVRLNLASDAALVFELVPRRATAYVLEPDGTVGAVWNPRRGRPGPGDLWQPPSRRPRKTLDEIERADWARIDSAEGARQLQSLLMREVAGMTRLVAREVASRIGTGRPLREIVAEELARAVSAPTEPRIYAPEPLEVLRTDPGSDELVVAPYPLHQLEGRPEFPHASLAEAAEAYYSTRARLRRLDAVRAAVTSGARSRIASLDRTRDKVARQSSSSDEAERLRKTGDLLLATPHAPIDGGTVRVPDLYGTGELLEVSVDPARSLAENAERFYRRARRAERRVTRQAERIARLEAERARLRALLDEADEVSSLADCDRLLARAARAGLEIAADRARVPEATGGAPTAPPQETVGDEHPRSIPGVRRYRAPDGVEILVGRSARGNDHLSHRVAARDDWWLHARGPGSHVVLRNPGRDETPPQAALRLAAGLAAWFSKARQATKTEVSWTRVRDLKKPRGAPPGLVLLGRHETLMVSPASPTSLGLEEFDPDPD